MLTFFTIPRAFAGQTGVVQDNAIASWARLDPHCDVILFGDDPGVAEAAARHGVRHIPDVKRNSQGTPTLSDVFPRADASARHPLLCFVNADIILFKDLLDASQTVSTRCDRFMMVSSRFNSRITRRLEFSPNWDRNLRAHVLDDGCMYPAAGSDIFLYPRGLLGNIPSFAIGRGYWDNWLMFHARQQGARLIDATEAIVAVHQDHGYMHIAGAPADAEETAGYLETEEAKENLALAGGQAAIYTVYDATDVLTRDGRLVSTWHPVLLPRRAKAWSRRKIMILAPAALHRRRAGVRRL